MLFRSDDKEIISEHYLIPRGCHIPERCRKDGISIVISGEVFDCSEYIKPEIKRAPAYFVKLSTTKKKLSQKTTIFISALALWVSGYSQRTCGSELNMEYIRQTDPLKYRRIIA